ncbi:unnamed protein product [Bursaphelenchus okinawaensis]|uniref:Peptidase A1 domain-containing protein n=1 Tax=Bursaphelenchus okinawaensis TaxID=465554 RepID=A0A811JUM3_9BILA|nr:unnamed protein product [Bursaphelenchus okinawaensis]CAG9084011.1 unnamed protein product [Bursaphelenchus okinawaensis]
MLHLSDHLNTFTNAYNFRATGGIPTQFAYNDYTFDNVAEWTGRQYYDKVQVGNLVFQSTIGVVEKSKVTVVTEHSGYLALGMADNALIKPIMNYSTQPRITIQEGIYYLKKNGTDQIPLLADLEGTITFGEYRGKECGTFKEYKTITDGFWVVLANVKIGEKEYNGQIVALNVGKPTLVPMEVYNDIKKEYASKEDMPDITITIEDDEYKMTPDQYAEYDEEVNFSLEKL